MRRFHVTVCRIALEEGFEINTRKSRFMRQGVRQQVAGLVLNAHPNVARDDFDRLKAILEANKTRLRPIMMTTLTLIAGMITMAFSHGPGSGSRRGMAVVVIGGQALCLLITLLLTPVAYSIFDDISNSDTVKWLRSWLD